MLYNLIDQDLPRTFPEYTIFSVEKEGPYALPLRTVLECCALYRSSCRRNGECTKQFNASHPDALCRADNASHSSPSRTSSASSTGFLQGMSLLAAILLLALGDDEFLCFLALLNLLSNPSTPHQQGQQEQGQEEGEELEEAEEEEEHLETLFTMDATYLDRYVSLFQQQLDESLPALSKHFQVVVTPALKPGMFLFKWILSLYSQSLPLDTVFRVWDCFLWETFKLRPNSTAAGQGQKKKVSKVPSNGISTPSSSSSSTPTSSSPSIGPGLRFLFRVALGILSMYSCHLQKLGFEECLYFLHHLPGKDQPLNQQAAAVEEEHSVGQNGGKKGDATSSSAAAALDSTTDADKLFQHIRNIKMNDAIWSSQ